MLALPLKVSLIDPSGVGLLLQLELGREVFEDIKAFH